MQDVRAQLPATSLRNALVLIAKKQAFIANDDLTNAHNYRLVEQPEKLLSYSYDTYFFRQAWRTLSIQIKRFYVRLKH